MLRLPGHTPTIEGEVAWTRARGEEPASVGIRFLPAAAEELGTIIDAVVAGFAGPRLVVFCVNDAARAHLCRILKIILSSASVIEVGTRATSKVP